MGNISGGDAPEKKEEVGEGTPEATQEAAHGNHIKDLGLICIQKLLVVADSKKYGNDGKKERHNAETAVTQIKDAPAIRLRLRVWAAEKSGQGLKDSTTADQEANDVMAIFSTTTAWEVGPSKHDSDDTKQHRHPHHCGMSDEGQGKACHLDALQSRRLRSKALDQDRERGQHNPSQHLEDAMSTHSPTGRQGGHNTACEQIDGKAQAVSGPGPVVAREGATIMLCEEKVHASQVSHHHISQPEHKSSALDAGARAGMLYRHRTWI